MGLSGPAGGWGGASGSSSVSQVSGDRDSESPACQALPAALDLGTGLARPVLTSDAAPTRPEPGGAMPPPSPAHRQAGEVLLSVICPQKWARQKGVRQVGIGEVLGEKWFSLLAGAHLGRQRSTLGVK